MANVLPPAANKRIIAMLATPGFTIRRIQRTLEVSRYAIRKRIDELRKAGMAIPACPCGKEMGHRSWCSFRYQRSKQRQVVLDSWHGHVSPFMLRKSAELWAEWKKLGLRIPFDEWCCSCAELMEKSTGIASKLSRTYAHFVDYKVAHYLICRRVDSRL